MAIPVWKLELLRFPRASLFTETDSAEVVALVSFLEDRYIRMWDVNIRAPLRNDGPDWTGVFVTYLKVIIALTALVFTTSLLL